jgi:predicted nucleotidyltransferase
LATAFTPSAFTFAAFGEALGAPRLSAVAVMFDSFTLRQMAITLLPFGKIDNPLPAAPQQT